jgi:hypothetical protein
MEVEARHGDDPRATGARATAICVLGGVLWLISLSGTAATGWGQVGLEKSYSDPGLLGTASYWASTIALFVTTLGLVRLTARRVSWLFPAIAAGFLLVGFQPPQGVAAVGIAIAGLAAVQAGFFKGELHRLVRIEPGRAQNIFAAAFTYGLPFAVAGCWQATKTFGARGFLLLGLVAVAATPVALRLYPPHPRESSTPLDRPEPHPAAAGRGLWSRLRRRFAQGGWTPRTLWGSLLNAASSGTTGAVLFAVPGGLDDHGYKGFWWVLAAFATNWPAAPGIGMWARICTRWIHNGLPALAVVQFLGSAIVAVAAWRSGEFIWWLLLGLVVLNFGRMTYEATLNSLVTKSGAQGNVLQVAAAAGASAAVFLVGVGVSFGVVVMLCGGLCLLATLAKTPHKDDTYGRFSLTRWRRAHWGLP